MILLNFDFLFVVGHANKIANSKISNKLYCNKKEIKNRMQVDTDSCSQQRNIWFEISD